jgi:hypothetical protein
MPYLWTGEDEPGRKSKQTNLKAQRKRKKKRVAKRADEGPSSQRRTKG